MHYLLISNGLSDLSIIKKYLLLENQLSNWLKYRLGQLARIVCLRKDIWILELMFVTIDEYDFLSSANDLLETDFSMLMAQEVKPIDILAK